MSRSFLTASIAALCLTGLAAHATASGQSGQPTTAPAAKTAEQLRYEEELRRYQAEQERHQKAVREADEARQRYETEQARHESRLDRIRRQQEERGMRVPRRPAEGSEPPAGEPAAASAPPPASGSPAPAAPSAPAATAPAAGPAASGPAADSTAPAAPAGTSDATAAAATAEATQCEQRSQRNRRRGRRAGGVFGFIARTFTPIGGVAGLVTAVVPVGELLGEAIASLLDCDEQQRAATATEEAVRGGVGSTASWTSETRPNVTGSSTVLAAEQTPQGDECLMVTDVVIVDGEETRAPKRLCRRPPSSRFVRV